MFRYPSAILLLSICSFRLRLNPVEMPAVESSDRHFYFLEGVQADLEYRNGLTLDAFAPTGERRPAAIVLHGSSGNKSTHLTQLFPLLSRAGYAWFAVNYRTLEDIREAVAFIESPGRFSIDPKPVLIGEDTGVYFALDLATRGGFSKVIGFGAARKIANTQDPHVPVFLFHGASDTDVPPGPLQETCRTWSQCRFELIAHGIHNLENWHPAEWDWKEEFVAILRNGRSGLWPDIVYSRPEGMPLEMDANIPEGTGPFPAIVIVHGGGWEAGDRLTYVSPVLSLFSNTHFAWFSIDYRLTPYVRNEEQVEDLRNAIRYIKQHAHRFNVNPNAIAVLGESAGGQIVTEVASEPCAGCAVQAIVSFYGVYDFVPWARDSDSKPVLNRIFGNWNTATLKRYSPISHIHAGMPPIFLLQGTADELYAGTIAYEKRLQEQHIPHELVILRDAPHGMENWVGHPEWQFYRVKLLEWLDTVLRPS